MLEITILEIEGGRVRLGFEADTKMPIHRREVWDRICNGNGNGNGNGAAPRAGTRLEAGPRAT
jgi:carbon storage regulator CsrA